MIIQVFKLLTKLGINEEEIKMIIGEGMADPESILEDGSVAKIVRVII